MMTSIKNGNSVANLRKTMIYDTNIDLVNDNVYTKFGLNRSIHFQDIEPPGRGQFRPQGHNWQELCRVPLNIATH